MRCAAAIFALSLLAAPAAAGTPQVMTDIPPVHALAAAVMAGLGTPGILIDRGADPHGFQLRPSQARALAAADLVFWVGPGLTPWLARAIEGVEGAGRAIALIDAAGVARRAYAADAGDGHGAADGDGDGHAGDGHAGDDHDDDDHDHDHAGDDPHAWLDPANARAFVAAIAAELAHADPANADRYAANAAAATAAIRDAEAEARAILAPVAAAPILVFHDAYGHFAAAFGLNVAASILEGDATAPGAARLAATRERIAALGPVCVFPEARRDPRLAEVVIEGTAARLGAPLDPASSGLEPGPGLYRALLTGLARAIADCVTAGG